MKEMKFRQSAIPYLLLFASLIIGVPYADKKAEKMKNQTLVFQIEKQIRPIAKGEGRVP